ncbi:nucleotide-binding universal stress UspA family protein [Stackebrandtia albiflava]|uniref:Nucleotide-binding universal stress UspA family protein n=1 Tax=Stackebrandtia albiflava TaxID=406432 RepID=A0A562UQD5_9ACTN|nr:universal stress protein [Stackebrandtia albiflava]TWJ07804.1 nucleotide-binding universal stress UspA family protein [Stackebrandtia albiflava]
MRGPVTVGYDGSDESRFAVRFAAGEARLRECPLHIVYASPIPLAGGRHFSGATWYESGTVREAIQEMMDEIVEVTSRETSGVDVRGEVVDSMTTGGTMIERSRESSVVVLGSRGRGGFTGLLLGSTSAQVAAHAHCPVVITRRPPEQDTPQAGRVVVGVDDSPLSQAALRFGFESAALRDADLVAVRVWQYEIPTIDAAAVPIAFDQEYTEEREKANLSEALAGWRQEYPQVTVIPTLVNGDPRRRLLEAAQGAAVLVVASRGRGGFASLVLGSTSHAVVQHAEVPVAVVSPHVYESAAE